MVPAVATREAFTQDWAENRIAWPSTLQHLHKQGGWVVEVGSFEGASALWLCDWLGPRGRVFCVDDFSGAGQPWSGQVAMRSVRERFYANTHWARRSGRLRICERPSSEALPMLLAEHGAVFDAAHIDGSHDPAVALDDAHNALRLLRVGGLLLLDDYSAESYPELHAAFATFAASEADRVEVVHAGYQLHLRRTA